MERRRMEGLSMHQGCFVLMKIYVIICLFIKENASFFEKVIIVGGNTSKVDD